MSTQLYRLQAMKAMNGNLEKYVLLGKLFWSLRSWGNVIIKDAVQMNIANKFTYDFYFPQHMLTKLFE